MFPFAAAGGWSGRAFAETRAVVVGAMLWTVRRFLPGALRMGREMRWGLWISGSILSLAALRAFRISCLDDLPGSGIVSIRKPESGLDGRGHGGTTASTVRR